MAVISSLAFATLGIFAIEGFHDHLTAVTLLVWRFFVAGVLLGVWSVLTRQAWPKGRDLVLLIGMGAVAYSTMSWLFLEANADAPVGRVSAVLYTYPALVTALVVALGWERLSPVRWLALAGTFIGTSLVALTGSAGATGGTHPVLGMALSFAAAVMYAAYIAVGSVIISRVSGAVATAIICLSAGGALAIIGGATGTLQPVPPDAWWIVAGLAIVATGLAVLGFFRAISLIGPGRAAILSTVEPVGAAILGWLTLGQTLSVLQAVGILVIMSSAGGLRWEPSQAGNPDAGRPKPLASNDDGSRPG
jgi:drug/metabolite transporter (DMT)-like permease